MSEGPRPSRRRTAVAVVLLALAMAGVGLAPHAWYSWRLGAPTYFKAAFDEDTYVRLWLAGHARGDRALSNAVLAAAYEASGHRASLALALLDGVVPPVAAACAFVLAATLVRGTAVRLLLALLLLVGGDLWSFGCSALGWLVPAPLMLPAWRPLVIDRWPGLVPDYYTSYLALFRSPEPQVSLCLLYLHAACLVALGRREDGAAPRWLIAALAAANAVLPLAYAFVAASLLVTEVAMAIALACSRRTRQAAVLALATSAALVLPLMRGGAGVGSDLYLFASREPVLTPAVVYGLLLLALAATARPWTGTRAWQTLPWAVVPLVLSNQQIVTGVMVSTRDFERYGNYPPLVVGAALCLLGGAPVSRSSRSGSRVAAVLGLLLLVAIARSQAFTAAQHLAGNDRSVAIARAVDRALEVQPQLRRIVLDDPGLVPAVAVRLRDPSLTFVLDYTETSRFHVPRTGRPDVGEGTAGRRHRDSLFEQLARTGVDVAAARALLAADAASIGTGAAFRLHFLFGLQDVWYPFSDGRLTRRADVARAIPQIVREYARFLDEASVLAQPVIRVAEGGARPADGRWRHRALAEGTVNGATATAWVQEPAASRERPVALAERQGSGFAACSGLETPGGVGGERAAGGGLFP